MTLLYSYDKINKYLVKQGTTQKPGSLLEADFYTLKRKFCFRIFKYAQLFKI